MTPTLPYPSLLQPGGPGGDEREPKHEASRMLKGSQPCEALNGILYLDIALPPQAVAATVDFVADQVGGGLQA